MRIGRTIRNKYAKPCAVSVIGKCQLKPGESRIIGGSPAGRRKHDATNQDSVAMGCALSQMPEMNRRFGHLGVKFLPNPKHGHTAVCRWKNRQSRLKYMAETGRRCLQEIRG